MAMKPEFIERIYAGWLAKVIGVRLGAPIEGWTYEKILYSFGELQGYPKQYRQFAADDDTNGPLFFLRALEDSRHGYDITPQDVGDALLNYASYESGFFWWGGYGISTEHTAYLNLRAGVPAPMSGSIEKNGSKVAEQIGGQIFIDTWGLVAPGNPDLAAKYARTAASVTHDGNGIYGGIFVACCISYAFVEQDIRKIIRKGLCYIPDDCEYARAVRSVMAYQEEHPENWRDCYHYVKDNFGYDRYPGSCHIIPNSSVMILSLLYGQGDFAKTLDICNMCGWDTDCNVGNVATIMGVRCGLEGIPELLRKPINDILICSSVVGSLNSMDIPCGADYIVRLAAAVAGQELPAPWNEILGREHPGCHFEYPGSTHGMRLRGGDRPGIQAVMENTDLDACTGKRCLRVTVPQPPRGGAMLYRKTYYIPKDFEDDRYQPTFSPTLYPGQEIRGSLKLGPESGRCTAQAYVHDMAAGRTIACGEKVLLDRDEWREVSMKIPFMENGLLDAAGFLLEALPDQESPAVIDVLLDDFRQGGAPDYTVDFAKSWLEDWYRRGRPVSQFTKLKGMTWLEDGRMHLSCADFGETYTGGHEWKDYKAVFHIRPECAGAHLVNVRVQGALHSYAAGFGEKGRFGFYKNDNGYVPLAEKEYAWETGKEYTIAVKAKGSCFTVFLDGEKIFAIEDTDWPYLRGGIGLAVRNGGHISCRGIEVSPVAS